MLKAQRILPNGRCLIRDINSLLKQASRSLYQAHQGVRVGDSLPHVDLYEDSPNNVVKMPDSVQGRNVVMFGVLGAFTPYCSNNHLPGYIAASVEMKKNGVDDIMCVSVNDAFVMGAWAAQHNTKGKIRMLADPTGTFIYLLGLGMNYTPLGGFRSQRFSMFITDNKIRELNVEPDGVGLCCSLAKQLLYQKYVKNKGELS